MKIRLQINIYSQIFFFCMCCSQLRDRKKKPRKLMNEFLGIEDINVYSCYCLALFCH